MPYSEHLRSDVWFEMVSYISSPDDGEQKFLEKHRWLECFVFSSDAANLGDVSGELQHAYSEFELNPTTFVNNIQSFSKLLCTRDLCKQLFSYFGEESEGILSKLLCTLRQQLYSYSGGEHIENNSRAASLWIQLQAGIFNITQSDGDGTSASSIEQPEEWSRMQKYLDREKEPTETPAESLASNQLQECLNRFREDKERNRAAQGK